MSKQSETRTYPEPGERLEMELEEVLRRTELQPVSSQHQFGAARQGPIKNQNKRDRWQAVLSL